MKVDFGKWALENHKLLALLIAILVCGGIYSYYEMPKLEDPEIVVRQALVVGIYPGASAHQMELEVADPLEKCIRETPGLDFIETRCYSDMCILKLSLLTTVKQEDIPQTWDIMRHKIDKAEIPSGAEIVVRDDFGDVFGMFYAVSGNDFTSEQLADYVQMIRRELQNVKGVSQVSLFGVPKQCIRVHLSPDRLANLGVLPLEVLQTLTGQNATVYSGYFLSGGNRIRVSVDDRYRSVDDISSLIIQGHEKDQVRLCDIAEISMEEETPVREYMDRDGIRAIGLSISANSGTDIIKVGKAVKRKISELQETRLPAGIEINSVFDQSSRVSDAMRDFLLNLLVSVILVIMVLVFTMGLRSGMVIGASLITIVIGSVFVLNFSGGTLQRVSLGSFILAMGMLVDNAIVIVDGILVAKGKGVPKTEALTAIGRKTAWPLLAATLIAILSFLPIYMSPDVAGLYIHDMFIVLAVSLLLSWFLALTHVPVMAGRWIYSSDIKTLINENSAPYRWLGTALDFLLERRWLTVGIVLLLLSIAGVGALFMPRGLFPDMEYDQLYMEYKLPEGRNCTQVREDLDSIRAILEKKEYITHTVASVGGTPARYNLVRSVHAPSLAYGELIVDFTSARELKKHINELQEEVSALYPDAYIKFKRYNLMFMPYPIQLIISGSDPAVLADLQKQAMDKFRESGVCMAITDEWDPGVPTMVVGYDQARARNAGLSRTEVGMSLLASTDGIPVGKFYDGFTPLNIYLDCRENDGKPINNLDEATVFGLLPDISEASNLTRHAPISQVTDGVRIEWEEPVVCRCNGLRTRVICASPIVGKGVEDARNTVEKAIREIDLPTGYTMEWGGEKMAENMAMENLFRFYPLAVLLIIALLVMLFRSYRTVAVLVLSIPAVFVGVVPAILISKVTFGFVSIVGILGLVGMIIKNGIILVDEIKLTLETEKDFDKALITASKSRLRPVTMAAFTTVLGMLPLLTDSMFKSLAATIIGGLLVGTIIVLLFIPVLYSLLFKKKD